MIGASMKLRRATSKGTRNAIFSRASASGATRSGGPDGRILARRGPAHAPVSRSVSRVRKSVSRIRATYGRHGFPLSPREVLSWFLANRLRALTASRGSTMYAMTWKRRITPSGRWIYALRARALPISGKGSGSWPTPTARDHKDTRQHFKRAGKRIAWSHLQKPGWKKFAGSVQRFPDGPARSRVGRLRAYGNAINAEAAAALISAYTLARSDLRSVLG